MITVQAKISPFTIKGPEAKKKEENMKLRRKHQAV